MPVVANERYELGDEIAAGGQGLVFLAHDRVLNRDVAVKVLKPEFTSSAGVVRRFLDEARITAQLQHPGIPPIHDLGTLPDGRSVLGTPAYMPPEQAIGAIDQLDARSDVFGLGAILCVLLTGKPPYVGADSESTRQLAARVKLDDAWTRLDQCGAEPEWIALCKQCLAPERDHRPRDAGVVAKAVAELRTKAEARARQAELDRVRAEGDLRTAELKATELRRRRRVQIALAATVFLLLAAGGAFAWWSDHRTTRKRFEDEQRASVERERGERNAEAVATLLGPCEDALRAEDAHRASLALETAEKRVAEGGAEQHADRLARCKSDLALLRDLDRIDVLRYTMTDGKYTPAPQLNEERRVAFGRWSPIPDNTSTVPFGERFAKCLMKDRVLLELDEWVIAGGPAALGPLLHAIDPDEYRDAMRSATLRQMAGEIATLSGKPVSLQQPACFAAALGKHESIPLQSRMRILKTALLRRPTDFGLLIAAGWLSARSPETANERELWMRSALMVRPTSIRANWSLANALEAKMDYEGAIACYRNMTRLSPNNANGYYGLGGNLYRFGDLPGALEATRSALRLKPDFVSARSNLGRMLIESGQLDEAIVELEAVVASNSEHAYGFRNLGLARKKKGDLAGAISAYERGILIEPNIPDGYFLLGELYLESKDYPNAVSAFRDAIRYDPLAISYEKLGEAQYGRRDVDKAIQAFQEAFKRNPKSASACDWLAFLKLQNRDAAGALPFAEQAVKMNPTVAQAHSNLGRARLETGNLPGAISAFREAVRLDPKHEYARQLLTVAEKLADGRIAPPPRELKP